MPGEVLLQRALAKRARRLLEIPKPPALGDALDATQPADEPTPEHILTTVEQALADGDTHYTDGPGIPALRKAIAAHLDGLGYQVSAENIYVTNGSREAIYVALQSRLSSGAQVLLAEPVEPGLAELLDFMGLETTRIAGSPATRFTPPAESCADLDAAAMVLAAPSPIAGLDPDPDEFEALLTHGRERGMALVVDISHAACRYSTKERPAPGADLGDQLMLAGSLSISHALPGWRVGFLVGPAGALAQVAGLKLSMSISAPTVSQRAALAALTGPTGWLDARRRLLRSRRDGILVRLSEAGLTAIKPDVFPGLLVDVTQLGGGDEVAARLRDDFKVLVEPGARYGASTADYARLNLLAPIDAIDATLRALSEMAEAGHE